jgi:hypothetical protein
VNCAARVFRLDLPGDNLRLAGIGQAGLAYDHKWKLGGHLGKTSSHIIWKAGMIRDTKVKLQRAMFLYRGTAFTESR